MLGLAFGVSSGERSGLTLHFDRLSVLSLPKEAAPLHPAFKGGAWRRRMGQKRLKFVQKYEKLLKNYPPLGNKIRIFFSQFLKISNIFD